MDEGGRGWKRVERRMEHCERENIREWKRGKDWIEGKNKAE